MLRIDLGNYEKLGTATGFSIVPPASVSHLVTVSKRRNLSATQLQSQQSAFSKKERARGQAAEDK